MGNLIKGPDFENERMAGIKLSAMVTSLICKSCEAQVKSEPFIVPPTWNKTEYHAHISPVWERAAQEISEARNLYIIGYSLPETDYFFRHLLSLALAGGPQIRRLGFLSPDSDAFTRLKRFLSEEISTVAKHLAIFFENRESMGRLHL